MRTGATFSADPGPRAPAAFAALALAAALLPAPAGAQDRPLTVRFDRLPLRAAIDTLIHRHGVPIVYADLDVGADTVSVECDGCGVETVLDRALAGTGLSWRRIDRQYVVVRRPAVPAPPEAATLSGTVTDSATGEPLAGAAVILQPGGTIRSTNAFGYFSFRNVAPGSHRVEARSVGYAPSALGLDVTPGKDAVVRVALAAGEIRLPEVLVRAERTSFDLSPESVAGGTFVPAAPSDHHQYFLEGEPVYSPAHQGGLVSTFNDEALADVRLRRGGLPPAYGGRIGGVLDLMLKEGSTGGLTGAVSAGTAASSIALNGPIAGPATFLLTGRAGYPDAGLGLYDADARRAQSRFAEAISKVTLRTSASDRISLTGYAGRDVYSVGGASEAATLDNRIEWRNAAVSLRWAGIALPSLFLRVSPGFTWYDFSAAHRWTDRRTGEVTPYRSSYRVGDFSLRADAEHFYDDWHTVVGGVSLVRHGMAGGISPFTSQAGVLPWERASAWEFSVHVQDRWRLLPSLLAEIGVRTASFSSGGGTFSAVDPRFNLLVTAGDDLALGASISSVTQFLHPYRSTGLFLFHPSVFWYPSTARALPRSAFQGTVGAERRLGGGAWTVGADAYYRITQNAHEFLPDEDPVPGTPIDDLAVTGEERAYGIRLVAVKPAGRLTVHLRYDLSWLSARFDSLNGGVPFVPRFHRRHEAAAGLSFAPAARLTAYITVAVSSDHAPTFVPVARRGNVAGPTEGFYDVNGSRLAGFERVEFGVTQGFSLPGRSALLTLRVRSAYGVLETFDWSPLGEGDVRERWSAAVRRTGLFPKYPALSLRVEL